MAPQESRQIKRNWRACSGSGDNLATGIGLGMVFSTALGIASHNLAFVGSGAGIGVGIAYLLDRRDARTGQ